MRPMQRRGRGRGTRRSSPAGITNGGSSAIFSEIESQNWFMGSGERRLFGGPLRLHAMVSLEPFTIQPLGSPQVFQTGETYRPAPLIDYQHPHDLFMSSAYDGRGRWRSAACSWKRHRWGHRRSGPSSFMHRPSASENPTAPLGHHQMDATHITHGVLTAGVERSGADARRIVVSRRRARRESKGHRLRPPRFVCEPPIVETAVGGTHKSAPLISRILNGSIHFPT